MIYVPESFSRYVEIYAFCNNSISSRPRSIEWISFLFALWSSSYHSTRTLFNLFSRSYDCYAKSIIFRSFMFLFPFWSIILFSNLSASELSTGRMDPRVGSGRVGSRFCWILAGRVGSALRIFKFFTEYFFVPESIWIFKYCIRIDWFYTIFNILCFCFFYREDMGMTWAQTNSFTKSSVKIAANHTSETDRCLEIRIVEHHRGWKLGNYDSHKIIQIFGVVIILCFKGNPFNCWIKRMITTAGDFKKAISKQKSLPDAQNRGANNFHLYRPHIDI